MDKDKDNIIINAALCLGCFTIIRSVHRHDYTACICGKTSVDGGIDYLKRGFDEKVGYIELSTSAKNATLAFNAFIEKINNAFLDIKEDWYSK